MINRMKMKLNISRPEPLLQGRQEELHQRVLIVISKAILELGVLHAQFNLYSEIRVVLLLKKALFLHAQSKFIAGGPLGRELRYLPC